MDQIEQLMRHARTFIYALVDPRNNAVRYVGRSVNPEDRAKKHLHETYSRAKAAWIASLKSEGLRPRLAVLDEVVGSVIDWNEAELRWHDRWSAAGFDLLSDRRIMTPTIRTGFPRVRECGCSAGARRQSSCASISLHFEGNPLLRIPRSDTPCNPLPSQR